MKEKIKILGFFLSILIMISCDQARFKTIKNYYSSNKNIEFKTYKELIKDNKKYKLYRLSNKNKKIINDYYKENWEKNNLSGGLLIAQGRTILYEKYIGKSNIQKNYSINKSTPIHIASVSKIITSLITLKLIEANKIELKQKVNTILKDFPYENIRIIDLLNHRSGLANYSNLAESGFWKNPKQSLTNKDVYNIYVKNKPDLLFKTNTKFTYTNSNFVILSLIIEKITKKSFPEVAQKILFSPLGMKNTFVYTPLKLNRISLSYFANSKIYPFDQYDIIYGDKNIYSTPRDLYKLSTSMFSDSFLDKKLMNLMFKPYSNEKQGVNNYGLGIRLKTFDNGKKLIYHTGLWHGNNSIFIHLPDENLTIIALGNKRSRSVYSAISLVKLFGNYPVPNPIIDSTKIDKKQNKKTSENKDNLDNF